jgi:hypothetical protein
MVEKHKTAVGDFLQQEKSAVATAADRLQEDIRIQVERMVSEHSKSIVRRLEAAVAGFTSNANGMAARTYTCRRYTALPRAEPGAWPWPWVSVWAWARVRDHILVRVARFPWPH